MRSHDFLVSSSALFSTTPDSSCFKYSKMGRSYSNAGTFSPTGDRLRLRDLDFFRVDAPLLEDEQDWPPAEDTVLAPDGKDLSAAPRLKDGGGSSAPAPSSV